MLRKSDRDQAVVIAGGITVFEALAAYDQLHRDGVSIRIIDLFSVRPIDRDELIASARATGGIIITVEDHYEHGGLSDAVLSALAGERIQAYKLAVRDIPHSGKSNADRKVRHFCRAHRDHGQVRLTVSGTLVSVRRGRRKERGRIG